MVTFPLVRLFRHILRQFRADRCGGWRVLLYGDGQVLSLAISKDITLKFGFVTNFLGVFSSSDNEFSLPDLCIKLP